MGIGKAIGGILGGVTSLVGGGAAPAAPSGPAAPTAADPAAERRAAENEAAAAANARTAEVTRQRKAGSLLAAGGQAGQAQTSSVLAYGKGKFGE